MFQVHYIDKLTCKTRLIMARITVEDCLNQLDNRFDLVLLASRRARQLARGYEPRVAWENDKPTVVALREIAAESVDLDGLRKIKEQHRPKLSALTLDSSLEDIPVTPGSRTRLAQSPPTED